MSVPAWPRLHLDDWKDTCDTLHLWSQVAGKICLAVMPPANHFWNTTFRVAPRGLRTPTLNWNGAAYDMTFDLVEHQFVVSRSDGARERVELRPRTVADFYGAATAAARGLGLDAAIWPVPVEVPDPIPFEQDVVHAAYDRGYAERFAAVLRLSAAVLEDFRARFVGKASPVHLFWGSFDLAATRFSGRRAPERPGADPVTREAYSHEVISHGFWPGGGGYPDAAFYAYAAPVPAGLDNARVLPSDAAYDRNLGEFVLPYEAVRAAPDPGAVLMEFLETTYSAAADLARWDRASLERSFGDGRRRSASTNA